MKWFLGLWMACMGTVFWMPLGHGQPSPFGGADLLIHAGMFLVFGVILHQVIDPAENGYFWIDWAIFLILVGLIMETIQGMIPGRSIQSLDYTANILGGWCGGIICFNRNNGTRWPLTIPLGLILLVSGGSAIVSGEWLLEWLLDGLRNAYRYTYTLQTMAYIGNGLLSVWLIGRWFKTKASTENALIGLYIMLVTGMFLLSPAEFLLPGAVVLFLYLICTKADSPFLSSFGRGSFLPIWFSLIIFSSVGVAERLQHYGLYLLVAIVNTVTLDCIGRYPEDYSSNGSTCFSSQPVDQS